MITIYIDGRSYEIEDRGKNLLEVCLSLKLNLPYFCWHPVLRSVGACRQCAVKIFKDENDQRGRLCMACMTPVQNGLRVALHDPEAVAFRAKVIEWLMMNHPHDCPVCDEGGECHLQDMTVMTGHLKRNYRFPKRTFKNQELGPFVTHEMNRCITCYRCARFYKNYAGGRDFGVFGWNNKIYFGRHEDGPLESPFSGNLVEVCPTGVFTDKTLQGHYVRKWDLTSALSICPHCSLGCNTLPGGREGAICRVQNRHHPEVNGYFLCDRGRYGYEYTRSIDRLVDPCVRNREHKLEKTTLEKALSCIPKGGMVGIGSARASVESNFALRELVGKDNFYCGLDEETFSTVQTIVQNSAKTPTLKEVERADALFIVGADPTTTAPRLSLSLRQSVLQKPLEEISSLHIPEWDEAALREVIQENRGPLFIATSGPTLLDDIATQVFQGPPQEIARLAFQVAHELDPSAPSPKGLSEETKEKARCIASALRKAKRPLIVSGAFGMSLEAIQAVLNITKALDTASHLCTLPECNSFGLALLEARSIESSLKDNIETLIILETDLYRYLPEERVAALLTKAKRIVVIDQIVTKTTTAADILLPVASTMESQGTFLNNEGRFQRFYKVVPHSKDLLSGWELCGLIIRSQTGVEDWSSFDTLWQRLIDAMPHFAQGLEITPPASFRMNGEKIPRQSCRCSGRTALGVEKEIHEQAPVDDPDSPLSFSMEGTQNQPPFPLITRFWAPGWNSVQSIHRFLGEEPYQERQLRHYLPLAFSDYYTKIPGPFVQRENELYILPFFHLFGSEELSVHGKAIRSQVPKPYLIVNRAFGESIGLIENQKVQLSLPIGALTVRFAEAVCTGVALVPWGLPGMPFMKLPSWASFSTIMEESN